MGPVMKKRKKQSSRNGFTLVELIVASLVLGVVSVAAVGFQYQARRMALRANAEMTAARTARMVLDNWKKTGGDANFDPVSLKMGFAKGAKSGDYNVTVDGLQMLVSLSHNDIEQDALAMVTLRQIECMVQWRSDFRPAAVRNGDPRYIISTYVRKDEAGG
jgi:prepilin-type N-terminal cleavage/methylation domain-containing protein